MDMATLGVAAFTFVVTCMVFIATTVRDERCYQDHRSIAFDRTYHDPSLAVPRANERPVASPRTPVVDSASSDIGDARPKPPDAFTTRRC